MGLFLASALCDTVFFYCADKNFDERQWVIKQGFRVPDPLDEKESELLKLYAAHKVNFLAFCPLCADVRVQEMPDIFVSRFSHVDDDSKTSDVLGQISHFQLVVDLKQFVIAVGEPAEVYVSLYSCGKRKFITYEEFH